MLAIKQISKSFKKDFYAKSFQALSDVSFEIKQGDLVGFLGANGAGKTTTLKIILNFIKADSGEVDYKTHFGSLDNFFKKLGYLPERPYFHANLTGREFVTYMAQLNDVRHDEIQRRTKIWSERLRIDHALDRKLANYSKGMLQRIGFVSCLLHEPDFLILDEPVSGLDPIGRKEIKDVMLELNRLGKTIFFSSHIVSDVEEVCNSLVVLDKGKLIYDGSVESILTQNAQSKFEAIVSQQIQNKYPASKISDNSFKLILPLEEKKDFLKYCVETNVELIKLTDIRPSLEEIVYGNVGK